MKMTLVKSFLMLLTISLTGANQLSANDTFINSLFDGNDGEEYKKVYYRSWDKEYKKVYTINFNGLSSYIGDTERMSIARNAAIEKAEIKGRADVVALYEQKINEITSTKKAVTPTVTPTVTPKPKPKHHSKGRRPVFCKLRN